MQRPGKLIRLERNNHNPAIMKLPLRFLPLAIALFTCNPSHISPSKFKDATAANNAFGLNLLVEEHQDKSSENIFISRL